MSESRLFWVWEGEWALWGGVCARRTNGLPLVYFIAPVTCSSCAPLPLIPSLMHVGRRGDAANPRLVVRNAPDGETTLRPTAAVDLNGGGHAALLFDGFEDC